MNQDLIKGAFETHDQYVKSLERISLWPTFSNMIDTLCTEHYHDGQRSSVPFENGHAPSRRRTGTALPSATWSTADPTKKRAFLFHHNSTTLPTMHSRNFLKNPFSHQREAGFREVIGPPSVIQHLNPDIVANLRVLERVSKAPAWTGGGSSTIETSDNDTTVLSAQQGSANSDVSMDS